MSDEEKAALRPASAQEIEESLSFALRFDGRKRVGHTDEAMAQITVERLISTGVVRLCAVEEAGRAAPSTSGRGATSARALGGHDRLPRPGAGGGEVIHVITERLEDLSDLLRSVGGRDEPFPIEYGRGDGATHPGARDPRDGPGAGPGGRPIRDIFVPDLRLGSGIKVPTRDFR